MGALLGKGVWKCCMENQEGLHSGRHIQLFLMGNTTWQPGRYSRSQAEQESQLCFCKKKQSYCNVCARTACKEQELIFQFCLAVVKIELECCIHLGHQISKHELSEKSLRKSSISFWKEIRNLEYMTCEERFSELELIRLKKRKFRMGTITDFARLSPTNKEGCSVYLQQVG